MDILSNHVNGINTLISSKKLALIEEAHSLTTEDNDHIRNYFLNKDPVIKFIELNGY